MRPDAVCLGIDVGGGGARAALGTPDGTVLEPNAAGTLQQTIQGLEGVGAGPWVVQVGLAGLSRRGRRANCLQTLARLLPAADIAITSDAEVALWGALPEGHGVVVVAGTGSIALARDGPTGREARAGGYGYLVGDEGSAFWLGREAVRAVLAAVDGRGSATCLTDLVCAALGARDPRRLPAHLRTDHRAVQQLARLAPLVSHAAADGDPQAAEILAQAGQALGELALAAARGAFAEQPPTSVPVATCGGVWQAGEPLRQPFHARLRAERPQVQVVRPALPPVGGALLLACRRAAPAGPDPAPRIIATLPAC